ncbi:uncharacterized protein LOC127867235 [Dreissena polymorpha]|uniref:Uncharacterized protein n=1 Tax=Dreissena polymorpha TaxID=45954 RepID=A0A9D4S5A0_DREPO|nr:uncharacterized protein LOC127867235 [Dreissena polymorpha]KAH3890417.1 hypothetical protein DPMN_014498 [Dreissena polymorpha]
MMALQFLPAPHIPRAFETLFERATTDATRRLVDYISRQWVHGGSFEPSDWSVFRQDVRTNNDLEGYHNRLNGKAGSGVGFYRLVPHLRQESEMVRLLVGGSNLHRITTTRSAKVQKFLVSLWDKYEAREFSEFLAKGGQAYGVMLD